MALFHNRGLNGALVKFKSFNSCYVLVDPVGNIDTIISQPNAKFDKKVQNYGDPIHVMLAINFIK